MANRPDTGAEHPTCEACGDPIPFRPGAAIVCGRGGGQRLELPPPRFCSGRECQAARDETAIERAIAAGVILP